MEKSHLPQTSSSTTPYDNHNFLQRLPNYVITRIYLNDLQFVSLFQEPTMNQEPSVSLKNMEEFSTKLALFTYIILHVHSKLGPHCLCFGRIKKNSVLGRLSHIIILVLITQLMHIRCLIPQI